MKGEGGGGGRLLQHVLLNLVVEAVGLRKPHVLLVGKHEALYIRNAAEKTNVVESNCIGISIPREKHVFLIPPYFHTVRRC
jgi:hypothetical protein